MNNTQLLLSIGIPTLTVLVAMWRSDKRIDDLAKRIDGRIDGLDTSMNKRFDAIAEELVLIHAELRYFHGVTASSRAV